MPPPTDNPKDTPPADDPPKDTPPADDPPKDDPPDPDKLGDAGKKALDQERDARKKAEAAAKASDAKFEELKTSIAKAFGLAEDDDPKEQLEATRDENLKLKLQNAVIAAAYTEGADVELTWAHLWSTGKLNDLDPTAADFAKNVAARVSEAVKDKPALASSATPGGGGGPRGGSLGGDTPDMNAWIRQQAGHA